MTQDTDALVREARERLEATVMCGEECPDDRSLTALDGQPATFGDLRLLLTALLQATNDLASERNVSVGLRTELAEAMDRLGRK